MRVELVRYTPDCEKLVAVASKQTLTAKSFEEAWSEMSEEEVEKWIRETLRRSHFSPWEHCVYTFYVEGISRVTSHQLVRHRIASYTQHSQRYKVLKGALLEVVVPPTVSSRPEAAEAFSKAVEEALSAYKKLVELGVPPEDARYVLPQAIKTKLLVTMNARELAHFIELRSCTRAQWEIRAVAWAMWKRAYEVHPRLWKWIGPRCLASENSIREFPLPLAALLGSELARRLGLAYEEGGEGGELVQERCPELVPKAKVAECVKLGLAEALPYVEGA